MITEDYVCFETAKLLKEKGFDEYATMIYNQNGSFMSKSFAISTCPFSDQLYPAPTLQMAIKWLREVHNIAVVVSPSMFWGKYNVTVYKKGNDHPIGFDGNSLCPSYEQACESAIKYCLENLI